MQGIVATVEHSGCQGGGCGGGNHLDRLALGMKPERGSVTSRIANFETNPSQGTKTHHINPVFLSPSIFAVTLVPSLLSQQPNIFEIGTCKQHTHALPQISSHPSVPTTIQLSLIRIRSFIPAHMIHVNSPTPPESKQSNAPPTEKRIP
jgi:hypothetical protein